MKPSHIRQARVLELLAQAGYADAGETRTETVRIPTSRSPVFGATGGELRTLGGRHRMELKGTDRRVTVGVVTTCFYRVIDGKAVDFTNFPTKDYDEIRAFLGETFG